MRLLEVILENNIFEFNQEKFTQNIGTGMGQPPAPPYADSFMAKKIDPIIKMLLKQFSDINIDSNEFLKQFLDDIIMMFVGTTKKLHQMFEQINNIHPNIKCTMAHTPNKDEKVSESCNCPKTDSVPFLDTLCTIREGKVILDLYKKPTDRNQYLLTSSCHSAHCVENIPFSLALRLNRICTDISQRDIRHQELKEMILEREYPEGLVISAITRAKTISRSQALKPVVAHKQSRRPAFVTFFDPRLPDIQKIQMKHWRSMKDQDPYLQEVFPEPPLTAFKRQTNIKDRLIRAKVPNMKPNKPQRVMKGMKMCGLNCTSCPYIK